MTLRKALILRRPKAAVSKDARHPRPENTGLRGGGRPVGSVDPDGGAEGLAD
jgi:hypothetical protein